MCFWTCLVGVALIAASLSMLTDIKAGLAALLVGIMLFLFVPLIYPPYLVMNLHDPLAIIGLCRDLGLSGGALALAGNLGVGGRKRPTPWLVNVGRCFLGLSMLDFGVEHFLHPEFAPAVPNPWQTPPWIPDYRLWVYVTGAVFVVCGVSIVMNKGARIAATWLGVAFLLLVVFIYTPMEIVHPSIVISAELDALVETLAMSGAAFLLAGAMPSKAHPGEIPVGVIEMHKYPE